MPMTLSWWIDPDLIAASACLREEVLPPRVWESKVLLLALWELVFRLPERLRIVIVARYGSTDKVGPCLQVGQIALRRPPPYSIAQFKPLAALQTG
ncbi:MAG: hypothetical protein ACUVWZ_10295 [Anaerolineae bacterium]